MALYEILKSFKGTQDGISQAVLFPKGAVLELSDDLAKAMSDDFIRAHGYDTPMRVETRKTKIVMPKSKKSEPITVREMPPVVQRDLTLAERETEAAKRASNK